MANTSIDLVGLDFASLKDNLKNFLKNNTQFKDLDYEGSNINVLLDVLAYNTYLNGFYTNMVASEMFLDTAQLRDSVVSHAKELNYVPRSFVASKANITVAITPSTSVKSVVVPRYTSFTSRVGSNTYTFSTDETYVVTTSSNGTFSVTTDVYEGIVTTDTFVVDQSNTAQRFVLSNPTVDTSSLYLVVYEDGGQNALTYTKADGLIGVTSASRVFFVQAAENQQYEIVFGDNVFGRKPKNGSYVTVKYRACSGELPNGALRFSPDGTIDSHANVSVQTVLSATGGSVAETVSSIRFNAPRSFQSQDRAVTVSDYETLLKNRFSDIQAISVYGGEDADPPQYGKVFISVDVANADGAPQSRKQAYLDFIQDKTPLTIGVEFVDPLFMYLNIATDVQYNVNLTNKSTTDIKTLVQAAISSYSLNSLEDFNVTMFYSALCKSIDAADTSILSNDTSVLMVKRVIPVLNTDDSFVINFNNALESETGLKLTQTEAHYGHTIVSSTFQYDNSTCVLVDDTLGNVFIAAEQGNTITVIKKVGTVDYTTGKLSVSQFNINDYAGNYISIKARPLSKNISTIKNTILAIDMTDVNVTVTGVKQ